MFLKKIIKHVFKTKRNNFIGFDKYRKKGAYHWDEVESNSDYRSLIEKIKCFIDQGSVVLDVGCGDGAYLGYLSSSIGQGFGVDADSTAVKLANSKFDERGIENCKAECLTIGEAKETFEKTGDKFDVVYSADVIEHLPDPAELLSLAVSVIKKDGLVIIGTPLYISDELISPYHVKEFSKQEMRSMIEPFLIIIEEAVMPLKRKDKKIYQEGYYFAICKPL